MAKQTGLGDRFFVGGYDLSNDVGTIDALGGGPAPAEVTGIDVEGFERIAGLFDGRAEWSGWFDPDDDRGHDRWSELLRGDQVFTYARGSAIGVPSAGLVGKQPDYAGSRGDDGGLSFKVSAMAAAGHTLEWGRLHTSASRTDTTATNGTGVDGGAASSFGLVAYLQVLALTGTSVTVKLQQSSDNGVGDAWADVTDGGFAAATEPGAQRLQTDPAAAVERYLRVVSSGTFTSAQFLVMVMRRAAGTVV